MGDWDSYPGLSPLQMGRLPLGYNVSGWVCLFLVIDNLAISISLFLLPYFTLGLVLA